MCVNLVKELHKLKQWHGVSCATTEIIFTTKVFTDDLARTSGENASLLIWKYTTHRWGVKSTENYFTTRLLDDIAVQREIARMYVPLKLKMGSTILANLTNLLSSSMINARMPFGNMAHKSRSIWHNSRLYDWWVMTDEKRKGYIYRLGRMSSLTLSFNKWRLQVYAIESLI